MKLNELMMAILAWAARRASPFSSAECYEQMKGVDDIKELSDTVRRLYIGGHLARQKLDGFRFTYALASAGLNGFEIYQPVEVAPADPAPGETAGQPRQKPVRAAKAVAPAIEAAEEKQIPVFLLKDAPTQVLPVLPAPVAKPTSADSALMEQFADAGNMFEQFYAYAIDDGGQLDISNNDTLISLPAAEVKRLMAFLDRVKGLL